MTNVVRCDGCGATRTPDVDFHGWFHVEVDGRVGTGDYSLDTCSWTCLRDVSERLGDLPELARYRSLGCQLAVAVADVMNAHGPLDPALGVALKAWEAQLGEDADRAAQR